MTDGPLISYRARRVAITRTLVQRVGPLSEDLARLAERGVRDNAKRDAGTWIQAACEDECQARWIDTLDTADGRHWHRVR